MRNRVCLTQVQKSRNDKMREKLRIPNATRQYGVRKVVKYGPTADRQAPTGSDEYDRAFGMPTGLSPGHDGGRIFDFVSEAQSRDTERRQFGQISKMSVHFIEKVLSNAGGARYVDRRQ